MRVAVLTLTRDRLQYTKDCFGLLRELGGCDFDHYVLDQGSEDGTQEWLLEEYEPHHLILEEKNIGIHKGMNKLWDAADGYDVLVKFDNDCELTREGTLEVACRLVHENPTWIMSPKIAGLGAPPGQQGETEVGGERVGIMPMIGGIFMAIPGDFHDRYRFHEASPIWGMADSDICHHWKKPGNQVGYLLDYIANHYETTEGQKLRYPAYFERKDREYTGG